MHMNVHGLVRELSGPRPLCRVVDIYCLKAALPMLLRLKTSQSSVSWLGVGKD